jgi:hypothetical protein
VLRRRGFIYVLCKDHESSVYCNCYNKGSVIWFFVNVVFNGIIKSVSTIKSINQVKIIFALIVIISMIKKENCLVGQEY